MDEQKKYAVLIDAENIAYKYVTDIMEEMANYGVVTYKRAYMDWSAQNAVGWKSVLLENAISPIQSIAYTSGKNSTDSTIIIDAMDILYSKTVDGFCIVSSDSDFTKLATRLRESGMTVIGMGEIKTPKAFIEACNNFKVLNLISNKDDIEKRDDENNRENLREEKDKKNIEKKAITPISEIKNAIKNIIISREGKGGNLELGELGRLLNNRYSEFDTRNYGYSKLSVMLKDMDFLNLIETENNRMFVQLKGNARIDNINQKIVNILENSGGNVPLSKLAQLTKSQYPTFSPKDYGYSQFKKMIESIPQISINKQNAKIIKSSEGNNDRKNIENCIINALIENDGKFLLSSMKSKIRQTYPNFEQQAFGYSRFIKFLESIENIGIQGEYVIIKDSKLNLKFEYDDSNDDVKIEKIDIRQLRDFIANILSQNNNAMNIGMLKEKLLETYPEFNLRDYDCSSFKIFLESMEGFKIIENNANID